MNNSAAKPRSWLVLALAFVSAGIVLAWMGSRNRNAANQDKFLQQTALLEAKVANLERTVAELNETLRQRSALSLSQPTTPREVRTSADPSQIELAARLAHLAIIQSNTLFAVNQLIARSTSNTPDPVSPETITVLDRKFTEQKQRVDDLTEALGNLVVNLNLPPEVAVMNPDEVYANAALRAYWPFFRAKKELDTEEFVLERLRVRLLQTQVDLATQQAAPR